jgi:hypothetical protein
MTMTTLINALQLLYEYNSVIIVRERQEALRR